MSHEQQELFSDAGATVNPPSPLAEILRPKSFEEFLGQESVIGPGTLLREAIEHDRLFSFVLWGPPGSGKTTLARLVAARAPEGSKARFVEFSAVVSGIPEVRKVIAEAERLHRTGTRVILFVDEIHRFNKAQQDAFLPHVEKGTITLIGATTENPYFEVIAPLLSRVRVFRLKPLDDAALQSILARAMAVKRLAIDEAARDLLIAAMDGDARRLLNLVEALRLLAGEAGTAAVTVEHVRAALSEKSIFYDKGGDAHYDTISAFIKSLRGSDPDAAVHWLARMIAAGEDPRFIARRMIVLAAEDVGNADPLALLVANAAAHAVEYVGLPEARIPLAQAACYLAAAPKSNAAYLAIKRAEQDVQDRPIGRVPLHLRNPAFAKAKEYGFGEGYRYPHDFPGHFVPQEYLPEELRGRRYYVPTEQGREKAIKERLDRLRASDPS